MEWAKVAASPYHGRIAARGAGMAVGNMESPTSLDGVARSHGTRSAIEIRGLSLTFDTADGPVEALTNVDLRVDEGEFVSLIGPSGCGKTTLLRLIADLEQPTSGAVAVNGVSPEQARLE